MKAKDPTLPSERFPKPRLLQNTWMHSRVCTMLQDERQN